VKTNFRIQRAFFSAAKKCALAFALITIGVSIALAQTNIFPSSGNVGIGTTAPTQKLEVAGTGLFTGAAISGNTAAGVYILDQYIYSLNGSNARDLNVLAQNLKFFTGTSYAEKMRIDLNGNVGIGTNDPTGTLHVTGSGQNNTLKVISTNSVSGGMVFQNTQASAQAVAYVENNRGSFASYGGLLYGGSNNAVIGGELFGVSRADKMFLFADGASNQGMAVGTLVAQPLILGTHNAERMRVDSSGNVGIGTTTPGTYYTVQAKVEISSATYGVVNVNSGSGYSGGLSLSRGGTSDWLISNRADGTAGRLAFFNATGTEQVKFLQNGDVEVAGTINAKYQDVAEWVPSAEKLYPGTVVALDSTKSNQVISSRQAYDTRVAGVISAQPGIALGESGEGKVLVATTGRVRVKVDASRAPIQIGDLLVTSDVAGLAMKSEPVEFGGRKMHMPGTIIGKALEPLAKGKGEILVLLSLQ
jgi:hypothetical protein